MSTHVEGSHGSSATAVGVSQLHGLMAEFETPEAIVDAAERAHAAGYRSMDAYSPFPVEGLAEAMGFVKNRVATIVLIGGLLGAFTAFFMQWYTAVIDYPINIGGRPYNTWPAFMVITFELTVLGAATFAVVGMLGLNGLPRPYHSAFNSPRFDRASQDRFFLCIQSDDPKFDREQTRAFLLSLQPIDVSEVEQ